MTREKAIEQLIFSSVEDVNKEFPKEKRLRKATDTVLFGGSCDLDSLGLVTLLAAIEQRIEDELGISITLADERAMSQKYSPFRTIGTLKDYILMLINEKDD